MINAMSADYTKIYDMSRELLERYKDSIVENKIDASGKLVDTADFDVDFEEDGLTVYFILESYWYYVEEGRNKSTGKYGTWETKQKDIEEWLKRKISKGYFIPRNGHKIPRTPKEIARTSYVIARKITQFGYYGKDHHGQHILKTLLDQAEEDGTLQAMIDSVVKVYDEEVNVEFQKL